MCCSLCCSLCGCLCRSLCRSLGGCRRWGRPRSAACCRRRPRRLHDAACPTRTWTADCCRRRPRRLHGRCLPPKATPKTPKRCLHAGLGLVARAAAVFGDFVRSLRSPVARGSLRSLISLRAAPDGLCARRRRSLVRLSVVRPSVLGFACAPSGLLSLSVLGRLCLACSAVGDLAASLSGPLRVPCAPRYSLRSLSSPPKTASNCARPSPCQHAGSASGSSG